jgi:hypothetical protein
MCYIARRSAIAKLSALVCALGLSSCGQEIAPPRETERSPLKIVPNPVNLGLLQPGSSAQRPLVVNNPGLRSVSVRRIESSCPCIRVEPGRLELLARAGQDLMVTFDPTEEPDFRGGLLVEVGFFDENDRRLATAQIQVERIRLAHARAPTRMKET